MIMQSTQVIQSVVNANNNQYVHSDLNIRTNFNMFQQQLNINNRRMNLLDEYAKCLQRQNKAKSLEIQVLHEQLNKVFADNQNLRTSLRQIRQFQQIKFLQKTCENSLKCKNLAVQYQSVSIQTIHQQQIEDYLELKNIVKQMGSKLEQKDEQIQKYHKEGEEMFIIIEQLEKQIKQLRQTSVKDKEKIKYLQLSIKSKEQKLISLNETLSNNMNYQQIKDIRNNIETNQELKMKISLLITQNNELIEQNRNLQKQKNEYYHQIKKFSRISFGKQNLSKSNLKTSKIKDQRFRQIEQNLRKIKLQNKQLQANLVIC